MNKNALKQLDMRLNQNWFLAAMIHEHSKDFFKMKLKIKLKCHTMIFPPKKPIEAEKEREMIIIPTAMTIFFSAWFLSAISVFVWFWNLFKTASGKIIFSKECCIRLWTLLESLNNSLRQWEILTLILIYIFLEVRKLTKSRIRNSCRKNISW